MSCHAILKNLYEPKMHVIFDHSLENNSGNRDNVADEDVYRRFEKHNYVLSFIHCHGICVYIVFLLLIARLIWLAIILPAEVSWKRH